jgi:hypothetical protein
LVFKANKSHLKSSKIIGVVVKSVVKFCVRFNPSNIDI